MDETMRRAVIHADLPILKACLRGEDVRLRIGIYFDHRFRADNVGASYSLYRMRAQQMEVHRAGEVDWWNEEDFLGAVREIVPWVREVRLRPMSEDGHLEVYLYDLFTKQRDVFTLNYPPSLMDRPRDDLLRDYSDWLMRALGPDGIDCGEFPWSHTTHAGVHWDMQLFPASEWLALASIVE